MDDFFMEARMILYVTVFFDCSHLPREHHAASAIRVEGFRLYAVKLRLMGIIYATP